MKIRIKKIRESAVLPMKAHVTDAGFDLTATSKAADGDGNIVYGTGLAFEIPDGYVGLLFPRSSNAKRNLLLSNSVGVLDSGYRGEVFFKFKKHYEGLYHSVYNEYEIGDKIGQIVIIPYPEVEFECVKELSRSERGEGGFGSSGK